VSYRGIRLRSTPRRLAVYGDVLRPPYTLATWCRWCGMPLAEGEQHTSAACRAFAETRDAERALREVSS
jgi:hypothetical protein